MKILFGIASVSNIVMSILTTFGGDYSAGREFFSIGLLFFILALKEEKQ